jgi:hypothetical protein
LASAEHDAQEKRKKGVDDPENQDLPIIAAGKGTVGFI